MDTELLENKNTNENQISNVNPLWKVWEHTKPINIKGTQCTIRGFSIAALRTNFYIKELGIMLDAGISGNFSPDYLFISHGHSDHTSNLPFHLYALKDNRTIQIYVPKESVDNFKSYVDSAYKLTLNLNNNDTFDVEKHTQSQFNGLDPNEQFDICINGKNNKKVTVETIQCTHSVPCLGYGFSEKKQRLKSEYNSLQPKEICILKKQGVEISDTITHYFLLFLGDTSKLVLENDNIFKYKTIMIECTFILDDELVQADKTKHMHWNHLLPYIQNYPDITFILFHFSQRYKRMEIDEFFDKQKLDHNLNNIIVWNSH